jgi:hypothetical protein
MIKLMLSAVLLATVGTLTINETRAAAVNNGDVLTITSPTYNPDTGYISSGSFFVMDMNGDGAAGGFEKSGLSQGTTGIVIGRTTPQGANHTGSPTASDTNAVDQPWFFFANTGSDYLRVAVTGNTTSGLDLSGWTVTWNGIPAINMGSGPWKPTNCASFGCGGHTFTSGNAQFTWDGVYGHSYVLNYAAIVPRDGTTSFGGVHYFLHLEGTVVPIPAAFWLLASGLIGLMGTTWRRKKLS